MWRGVDDMNEGDEDVTKEFSNEELGRRIGGLKWNPDDGWLSCARPRQRQFNPLQSTTPKLQSSTTKKLSILTLPS